MNNPRRKRIEELSVQIEDLRNLLEEIMAEEEEYKDNMPENLQTSERYEIAENACDNMDSALSSLEEAIEYLDAARE